jgi:glycine cleavage system H protein
MEGSIMPKLESVRVRQELLEEVKTEVEKTEYKSLSEFVSDAIRLRLQTLAEERILEYLERDRKTRAAQLQTQSLYTPKHTFAQVTPQRNVKVGITDHFQSQLKEIVSIHTANIGEKVSKDEPFGVAETWWFTYDLYSPLNGKIVSINDKVTENPFILNADPYQWILEVQPESTEVGSWMNGLLSLEEYQELIRKLEGRAR